MTLKLYTIEGVFLKEVDNGGRILTGILEWPNGTKAWYSHGKVHRLDGPAIVWNDGTKHWFINGKEVTELQCKLLYDIMKLKGLL